MELQEVLSMVATIVVTWRLHGRIRRLNSRVSLQLSKRSQEMSPQPANTRCTPLPELPLSYHVPIVTHQKMGCCTCAVHALQWRFLVTIGFLPSSTKSPVVRPRVHMELLARARMPSCISSFCTEQVGAIQQQDMNNYCLTPKRYECAANAWSFLFELNDF